MFARFHFPGSRSSRDSGAAAAKDGGGSSSSSSSKDGTLRHVSTQLQEPNPTRSPSFMLHGGGMPQGPLAPCRLGYLYSAPLVHKAGGQAKELDMQDGMHIDISQELGRLKRTLHDAQRRILFRAEVATVKNCRKLLTIGCRMLHYTGIGKPSCLIFEKEKPLGETNILNIETLTELFAAGGVRTQLVFVSARHSEIVGRAFLAAGVRHVVAMKWDAKVSDRAACIFAEFFYLSIAMGRTVRQAFEVASTAAVTETGASGDDEQFLLLPAEGDHDLAIFDDAEVGSFVDESPPPVPNTCDPPPVPFVGRNVAVQEVVGLLSMVSQGNRCITVRGRPGVGKTALASRVCQYLAERNLFDAIYLVPLRRKVYGSYEKETLCKVMGAAIGFEDASNEREIVFLLQDKHPSGRVIMVLDGPDRFFNRSNSLVQVLSYLLSRIHGLHLLVTAEGSVLGSGSGRLESSSEKVVHLGPLSDVATAHMLANIAPPGFKLEEMMSRPYATKEEAYAELAASPVIRELRGHPKAIVMFAPLLEDHRLKDLFEKAKLCYLEASTAAEIDLPSKEEEEGGGGTGGRRSNFDAEAKELDASTLEKETEAARRFLRDPMSQRLWLEVVRQGGARQSSSMHQGVPWYRLTDALQEELRGALVDALRMLRLQVTDSSAALSSSVTMKMSVGAFAGAGGVEESKASMSPSMPLSSVGTEAKEEGKGAEVSTYRRGGETDDDGLVRGLEPGDIQFIKDRLGARMPGNDLVKITDFSVFCEGWVPVQKSIRLLCREWLCNSPRLVHGFLSRKETEDLLQGHKEGTFIFRFSTSHLGLLSISFVGKRPASISEKKTDTDNAVIAPFRHFLVQVEEDRHCVVFMEPGRSRHASLEDLVMSSTSLLEFYPGVPKAQALVQMQKYKND
ncbi:hypothetical protein VYU27_002850 [Nannochloropsis oceanica]